MNYAQLGVSIPVNTRETPVMIISELCSNGDLFDYLRGSQIPAVRRMVSRSSRRRPIRSLTYWTGVYDARHRPWDPIPSQSQAIGYPPGLQVFQHSHNQQRCRQDHRLRAGQSQAINSVDGPEFGRDSQLASARVVAPATKIQLQGRCVFVRDGVLGNVPMASARTKIPLGGQCPKPNPPTPPDR